MIKDDFNKTRGITGSDNRGVVPYTSSYIDSVYQFNVPNYTPTNELLVITYRSSCAFNENNTIIA
jgi:hypothetical protein